MLIPTNFGINEAFKKELIAAFKDNDIRAALMKEVRIEIDNYTHKSDITSMVNKGTAQSYDSLTAGSVNMQAQMAASGYEIFGRTRFRKHKRLDHKWKLRKMKNHIKYGKAPQRELINRGDFVIG